MMLSLRCIAFGAALGTGLFAFQQSFADSTTPPVTTSAPVTTPAPSAGDHHDAGDHHGENPRGAEATHRPADGKPHDEAPKHEKHDTDGTPPDHPPVADQPPKEGLPLSTDELGKEFAKLSPETREALMKTLKDKGVDGLSSMSESDARTTFASLPNNVKDQIQAKWDGLSDEQRVAIKKMGADGVKELFASQMKQMVKQTVMDPVTKPIETVVATTQAAVAKTTTVLQKGRDYVQKWLAKLRGEEPVQPEQSEQPQQQATQ